MYKLFGKCVRRKMCLSENLPVGKFDRRKMQLSENVVVGNFAVGKYVSENSPSENLLSEKPLDTIQYT